jgi:hypothetical protein
MWIDCGPGLAGRSRKDLAGYVVSSGSANTGEDVVGGGAAA